MSEMTINYKKYLKRKTMNYIEQLKKWFEEKIKIHKKEFNPNYRYKKWDIWYVNFWINIWNEFNKIRPALVITNKKYTKWNNLIVIPLTSFKTEKNILNTDIIIKTDFNKKQKSILRLNHLRDISKNRLIKKVWRISDDKLKELDIKLKDLFNIRE